MAYPLPVTEQPIIEPRGHPTNIRTVIDPPAVDAWDYFPSQSRVQGARLFLFNTIATPWWATESAPATGAFNAAFSSAFDGGLGSPQNP